MGVNRPTTLEHSVADRGLAPAARYRLGAAIPTLARSAPILASALAAATITRLPGPTIALVALVVGVVALHRWPTLIWAVMLVATLLFWSYVVQKLVFAAGGLTVYLADLLPVLLAAGALAGGIRKPNTTPAVRITIGACATFCLLTLVTWYRSIGANGFTAAMQARHLFPLVLICVLPFSGRFIKISSDEIVTALSIGSIALAVRTLMLLRSGSESFYGGNQRLSDPTAGLGVQRTFQTWEPFLAAAIGLTLLAYVLLAKRPSLLHYVGLGAAGIPVLFGFFRVAWVLTAVLGALTFALAKSPRRGKIAAAFAVLLLAFATAGALSHTTSRYSSQFGTRANAITLHLDSYRANEYHAVWTEIRKNVLWGQGFGTDYIGDWTTNRSWAHNAYEWLWWRVGLVGVSCFVLLLVGATIAGISAWRHAANANDRALALGLTLGVAFTALAANFHLNFEESQNNLFIGLAVAQILILACRQARV